MRYLIYGALVLLGLRLLEPLVAWWRVWQTRFREKVRADKADPMAFPPELAPIFAEAADALTALGFEPSHAQWTDAPVAGEPRRPSGVFVQRETCTFAEVSPPTSRDGRRLYTVAFTTFFDSGPAVMTVDGQVHLTPVLPGNTEVHDHCVNDVAAQWRAHARVVAERAGDAPRMLSASARMRAQCDALAAGIEHARADGRLKRASTGACSLTPRAAWTAARAMRAGARRIARADRSHTVDTSTAEEAWHAADAYALAHAEAQRSSRPPRARLQLFAVGLAVSAAALALFIGWAAVPGLIVVLLLHEAGHLAGMRLFGYRDPQILFVPFPGAAASRRKHDALPIERLVVLLLGPVPGIVLGILALQIGTASGTAWLADAGLLAVVVNYLNVLPFAPLDGGRIVDVLLLHRNPRGDVAFLLTSAVVAGLAGIVTGTSLLVLLSVAMLVALPGRWLVGEAAAEAMRQLGRSHKPRPERIRAAFSALNARRKPVAANARVALARAVMEHLDAPSPPRALALAGAALYGTLLVAPLVGTALILMPHPAIADLCVRPAGGNPAAVASDYGHALAEVCADTEFPRMTGTAQWRALVDRAGSRLAGGDSASAIEYFPLAHDAAVLEFDGEDPRRIATRKLVQELAAAAAARSVAAISPAAADSTAAAEER